MSSEKSESEPTLGPVMMNGVDEGGRESPGVGVSGNKPMVNGDLRDVGDSHSTADFTAVKTPVDCINNNSASHEDVAVVKVCVSERERDRDSVWTRVCP